MFLYCDFAWFVRASSIGCLRCLGCGLVLAVLVRRCQLAWWECCRSVEVGMGACEGDISVCGEVVDGQ